MLAVLIITAAAAVQGANVVAASPPAPSIARNAGDVVGTAASSYAIVGGVGFVFSTAGAVVRRMPGPVGVGIGAAKRWAKISAGFAGGQAAGQVWRRKDDRICHLAGAFFGGLAAATSLAEAPSSILTFMAFSWILDGIAPSTGAAPAPSDDEKIAWRGRSIEDIRAEAEQKAQENYRRRRQGDATRLKALPS